MAKNRQQKTSRRILRRRGVVMTFKQFAETKDRKAGSQSWAATGVEVQARAALAPLNESVDLGIKKGDQMLLVEGAPFGAEDLDLDHDWRVVIKGEDHQISGAVAAARTKPSDPAAYFEAMIRSGSKTSGP